MCHSTLVNFQHYWLVILMVQKNNEVETSFQMILACFFVLFINSLCNYSVILNPYSFVKQKLYCISFIKFFYGEKSCTPTIVVIFKHRVDLFSVVFSWRPSRWIKECVLTSCFMTVCVCVLLDFCWNNSQEVRCAI